MATMNCVGPTAPIVSGGNSGVNESVNDAPRKFGVDTVCAVRGPARSGAVTTAGDTDAWSDPDGKFSRSGRCKGLIRTGRSVPATRASCARCCAINSSVLTMMAGNPVQGVPVCSCAPASDEIRASTANAERMPSPVQPCRNMSITINAPYGRGTQMPDVD